MEKINLVIADSDIKYMELFKSYIRESEYIEKFMIKSFSSKEKVDEFLETEQDTDILLISPELLPEEISDDIDKSIILLNDTEAEKNDLEKNYTTISKFQPLNLLTSQIITKYFENNEHAASLVRGSKKTKVVSIYSTTGGSGKTTLAINLTKQLAKSKKVFYLSLEYLNSTGIFFPQSNSYDFSKIQYYLKANPEQLLSKIDSFKKIDQHTGINYFESASNIHEMLDVTNEEVQILIETLVNSGSYEFIIVDLDSTVHERTIGTFLKSDYIFWLLLDDFLYLQKTDLLIDQYKYLLKEQYQNTNKKIKFFLNKYLGNNLENNFSKQNYKLSGYLPYIPQWKTVTQVEQIYNSEVYNQGLLKLLDWLEKK